LEFSEFRLQSLENDWITARQIEAGRIAINRPINRAAAVGANLPLQAGDQRSRSKCAWAGKGDRILGRRCQAQPRPL
jgi:hypothetical protein